MILDDVWRLATIKEPRPQWWKFWLNDNPLEPRAVLPMRRKSWPKEVYILPLLGSMRLCSEYISDRPSTPGSVPYAYSIEDYLAHDWEIATDQLRQFVTTFVEQS